MQSSANGSIFKKLIQVCSRNQILKVERTNTLPSLHYGPLGTLLKRNIFNEWLSSLLKNNEFHMFPLEITNPRTDSFSLQKHDTSKDHLLPVVIDNYAETLKVFGAESPFGYAVYGSCINSQTLPDKVVSDMDLNFLRNLTAWTRISVIFFCHSSKPMNWFQYWSKQRCLWWRKHSSIPSKFFLSEVSRTASGPQQISLLHQSPWGTDKLETITVHGSHYVEQQLRKHSEKFSFGFPVASAPAIITCEAELDLAVFSYLANSYAEIVRDGERREILNLHNSLAPYKVCVLLDENANAENMKKLENVASHLIEELKETGISVLPSPFIHYKYDKKFYFGRLDEMSVPYAIILNESALLTGFADFRSRDTSLHQQIHLTLLTSTLVKYLNMEKQVVSILSIY